MKYIDIHAHLTMEQYNPDRKEAIERAYNKQVAIINIGTDPASSRAVVDLADEYRSVHPHIYSIPGIHPDWIRERLMELMGVDVSVDFSIEGFRTIEKDLEKEIEQYAPDLIKDIYKECSIVSLLMKHRSVVGIGECGIDLFRMDPAIAPVMLKLQELLFIAQIKIALEYDKPIMIHARESYKEILSILDEHFISKGIALRGNVHFFAGTSEEAQMFLDRGFTVSFTGVITFARIYETVVGTLPIDRMMSETDCPFVSPVPYRGQRCEPSFVVEVVSKIAKIRGQDLEVVQNQLLANAETYFSLNLRV